MTRINVVYKRPGEPAVRREIGNDVIEIHELLSGYLEALTVWFAMPWGEALPLCVLVNDSGRLLQMPPNVRIDREIICGPVIVTRKQGAELAGLSDAETLAACNTLNMLAV